ncbi:aminopeptidase N [Salinispirillum sp. LH 10-3-1]|uniref:Aminopeptidase N n=1 Tax=Salinispirillum sp. LH 10-3-1 TaxID=2952525 RepID=A0AB38YK87_9GAMM
MRTDTPQIIQLSDYQAPAYWVDTTQLTVSIFAEYTEVKAELRLRANDRYTTLQPIVLHGVGLDLKSLALNGQTVPDYEIVGEELRLPAPAEGEFTLHTVVHIYPTTNTSLEGLYVSGGMYCTQCEAEGFRKITYFPDRPDVLSVFTTRIEAPKEFATLLSNGNPIAAGELADDRHFAEWHDPFPKPAYLFALVAGDLKDVRDEFVTMSGRTIDLRIYVEPHNLHKTEFALESLKKSMVWDEQVYGREYDLDIFMIVAVDHFNMGAMENKGLNIFNSACVLADLETTTDDGFERIEAIVAHEYFHNWSGNRVTCRDWFQLSLKEGFTVFRDAEFTADTHARAVKRMDDVTLLRTSQFAEDAGPMAHPIRPDSYIEINNFYTLTVYEKGAEVVRMLHTLLGAERFRAASDLYFERFDGQAVTTEDFVNCMAEVSGIDLSQFQRWYDQAGTPRLAVTGNYDGAAQTFTLQFSQSCPATPGQPNKAPFHIPVKLGLVGKNSGSDLTFSTRHPGFDSELQVFSLRERDDTLVLEGVSEDAVPSLLRDFSAPVILEYPYTVEDLRRLVSSDSNAFNRWDAMQTLATRTLLAAVQEQAEHGDLQAVLTDAMRDVLQDADLDPAVKARLLRLPGQAYMAEQYKPVDPVALDQVHTALRRHLGQALQAEWIAVFEQTQPSGTYAFEHHQVARRALHSVALSYRIMADQNAWRLAAEMYRAADNMTDQSAALQLWGQVANEEWDNAMAAFYQRWHKDAQMAEQWLSIRASAPRVRVREVELLTEHDGFSWTNPNRVRSVIGGFAMRNPVGFHADNGAGYRFLADSIIRLNSLNPQIAARLCTPFTYWRRYTPEIQAAMQAQLKRILDVETLSKDVYEVVSKSLDTSLA